MAAQASLFVALILLCSTVARDEGRWFIVWNVGQGQWTTFAEDGRCDHFDMGGEYAPKNAIMSLCRARDNRLHFSHWDWDHISFLRIANRLLPQSCVASEPFGLASPHKRLMFKNESHCASPSPYPSWQPPADGKIRRSNGLSRVFIVEGSLIPGDSTSSEEKLWTRELGQSLSPTRLLVLGHHGSRTSTSQLLLNHLPHLVQAIASSRFRRYGHPHEQVIAELRRRRIPLLTTEDWGSIAFEL